MTEAEAKTKWCPMARTVVAVGSPDGSVVATTNRWQNGSPHEGTLCLGSGCMMWRWLTDGAVVNGRFAPFGTLSSTQGECGLSRTTQ